MLLEAYLKGCGEAMLTRFENQVIIQRCLEEIGKQVSNTLHYWTILLSHDLSRLSREDQVILARCRQHYKNS